MCCTCKVVILLTKPIVFLTFSLPTRGRIFNSLERTYKKVIYSSYCKSIVHKKTFSLLRKNRLISHQPHTPKKLFRCVFELVRHTMYDVAMPTWCFVWNLALWLKLLFNFYYIEKNFNREFNSNLSYIMF